MTTLEWWAQSLTSRALWFVLVALALTVGAGILASQLTLVADPIALLPSGSPAADDYRKFHQDFGGAEQVFIIVKRSDEAAESSDTIEDLTLAAEILADRLAESELFIYASSGLDEADETFFLDTVIPQSLLYADSFDPEDVTELLSRDTVRERIKRMRKAVRGSMTTLNATTVFTRDPFGLFGSGMLRGSRALSGAMGLQVDTLTGTFISEDDDAALIVALPASSEIDPESGRALAAVIEAEVADIRSESEFANYEFISVGGPLYAVHDERLLRRDLTRTILSSIVLVTVVLALSFRGMLLPVAAMAAVVGGVVWTGAFISATLGTLSAVGVGFAAILIGLGVDYAVHGGARFREARINEQPAPKCVHRTLRETGPGIATSAITTAAAFSVLIFAHFRPLHELGVTVSSGMLMILVASLCLGLPLLVLLSRRTPRTDGGVIWDALGTFVETMVTFGRVYAKSVVGVILITTLALLYFAMRLELDVDPRRMRPADHPALPAQELLVDKFDVGLETATLIIHGADLDDVIEKADRARDAVLAADESAMIVSPSDWLLSSDERAARLEELAKLPLGRAATAARVELVLAGFDFEAFAPGLDVLTNFGRGIAPDPPPPDAWPLWVKRALKQHADGTWSAAINVRQGEGIAWRSGLPATLQQQLESVDPEYSWASAARLGNALRDLAITDLRALSGFAIALLITIVLLSFKFSVRDTALSLLPVTVGTIWTFGIWSLLGMKLDLISVALLPVMLGIGVDDGLHAVHGKRARGTGGVIAAALTSGRAMTITTLTTICGFGSLAWAKIPGLRWGGVLIAVGCTLCLLATLTLLPAVQRITSSRLKFRPDTRRNR